MPPFVPNSTEDESASGASSLTEMGPAARQRSFVEPRLAGSSQPADTVEIAGAAPRAMAAPSSSTERNLADERRRNLAAFRTRQFEQATVAGLAPSAESSPPPGPLAAMSRGTATAADQVTERPDFIETNQWMLLGPSVVRDGQSGKQSAMSGRVRGIAVAPGGERLYIATANGGVWRSENGGQSWLSLMDAFDLNPTLYRADSLACGAIALVPGSWAGEDTIYVGSGEPGVAPWFQGDSAYFGVGPIVSTDGGLNWATEPSTPTLAGSAFYALAVDPARPQRVVAATLEGLYRREADVEGSAQWLRQREGYFCSVVVSHLNTQTTFYAAEWGGTVWQSSDGEEWTPLGEEFPETDVGRIGLAVQVDNPNILYAVVANSSGHLLSVYRLDRDDGRWRPIRDVPSTLFGPDLNQWGQGGYDLAVVVDPTDANRIYLGGSIVYSDGIQPSNGGGDWSGALYRCEIEIHPTNKSVRARATYIGGSIHGDIHTIQHAPGDAEKLWVGCDGGIFFSAHPTADPLDQAHTDGLFVSCNIGLSTLTMNCLGMHPTEEAVLFCGTQDSGGLRYTGDPVWLYSSGGDSGYFVINWDNPYQVATTYINNQIYRSLDGGMRYSYHGIPVLPANGEGVQFYAPLVGTPYAPEQPESATRLAFGGSRVWLSDHFGGDGLWWNGTDWSGEVDWVSLPNNDAATDWVEGIVEALVFASADKLYAGTTAGLVYRYELTGNQWQRTPLPAIANDQIAAGIGSVTSIAVDLADGSGNAIYVTLGGIENPHRVWHFDGTQWTPRSGLQEAESPRRLLNVQHNAIVVDPARPSHLYVAADIGVWHSEDGGQQWSVFARGLPDAAVVDLKLYEPSRLLRAATHGRGVYEFDLGRPQRAVDLYIRDHLLDLGRHPAATGLPDPTQPGSTVQPGQSPDIKLDPPDHRGRYQLAGDDPIHLNPFPHIRSLKSEIDFHSFATKLVNDSGVVVTHSRSNVQTQVYVQIHNRGQVTANNVRVMVLLAKADRAPADGEEETILPPLPIDYEDNVRAGLPIASDHWQTVGFAMLHGIRPGHPQIATFVLDADQLPTPGRLRAEMTFSLVAFVHSADDPFTAESPVNLAPATNRHVAHRAIDIAPFDGTLPAGVQRRKPQTPRPDDLLAEHRVRRGETLSHIAKHYYDSARQWPLIYRANRRLIGPNPNFLRTGWILKVPQL